MNQKTLCLLKPDIIRRKMIGKALSELEQHFRITRMKMETLTNEKAAVFYKEHKEKHFFPQLVGFMTAGPVVALELEGVDCIAKLRKLMGHFDPKQADANCLRGKFGISMDENSFHGSDSEQSAADEIKIIFEK